MSVWIAETLIATTLLMALVMMLRGPVARWLGASAAYWLWLLPIARMLLPAVPQDLAEPSPLHVAVDQAGLPDLLAVAPQPGASAAFPWFEAAIALWLLGVAIFVAIHAIGYTRFRRHILTGVTPIEQQGRIHIITSPHASGPLAFGIMRPYVVLPMDFALRYDALEQEMAIAHEKAHHDHHDLAANMVALLLLAIHWCNPVAWIAYRAYRADQETACDARVLALYGRDQAHVYGRAILKAAGGRQFAAACHLTRIATLKGRLKMLSNHDISLHRISWGMAAVALVTATGLALTASGSRAAQEMAAITQKVEVADFARLTDLVAEPAAASMPSLPEPSAMAAAPGAPEAPASLWPVDSVTVPAAPIVPAADMIAPVAPVAPPPASPVVRTENGRRTVAYPDGRIEAHRILTQAEIARMVPRVDVRSGCEGQDKVSRSETAGDAGGRTIRVRVCAAAIERAAERAAAQAEAQANRAARMAAREAARADVDAQQADRTARSAQMIALKGLLNARVNMARNWSVPARDRAEALRELDDSIKEVRSEMD
ncbi:M56 family metallopeptidase [Sphingobium sp.]|uniref:M56 family metallopeptidase n=1 Tax=Sphingobium sp. TaxID=1912891 RepID=UPI003BB64D70